MYAIRSYYEGIPLGGVSGPGEEDDAEAVSLGSRLRGNDGRMASSSGTTPSRLCRSDKAHGEIQRLDMLGERAHRDEIHAGAGVGAQGRQGDVAGDP